MKSLKVDFYVLVLLIGYRFGNDAIVNWASDRWEAIQQACEHDWEPAMDGVLHSNVCTACGLTQGEER